MSSDLVLSSLNKLERLFDSDSHVFGGSGGKGGKSKKSKKSKKSQPVGGVLVPVYSGYPMGSGLISQPNSFGYQIPYSSSYYGVQHNDGGYYAAGGKVSANPRAMTAEGRRGKARAAANNPWINFLKIKQLEYARAGNPMTFAQMLSNSNPDKPNLMAQYAPYRK